MTDYYVSGAGSNTSPYDTWAKAATAFGTAVTAATTAGDRIFVAHDHSESLSADTTYTFGANVMALCVNSGTGALATTAVIGAQSTNYAITLAGAFNIYIRGITFQNGTATASSKSIICDSSDGQSMHFESCVFDLNGSSSSRIQMGSLSGVTSRYIKTKDCTINFGNVGHGILMYGCICVHENLTIDSSGSAPTALFIGSGINGADIYCEGCNFSHVGSGTLIGDHTSGGFGYYRFFNCKFGSGMTIKAAASTVLNLGNVTASAFNCNAGDAHYDFYHADAFGETTVSATIYANDGAAYDGTNKCSWKIVTTANCSYYTPYVSPWMDLYHSGTSEISPYLEILRSGSTTKYQNDEVWSEWSYQGTSGSTKATIVSDRMTPLGTAADQTASSLDASGWTGEDATNNAFMKLEAGAITPAEIGHIRARVCVGEPSITVYVDPKIRGLS